VSELKDELILVGYTNGYQIFYGADDAEALQASQPQEQGE